MRKIKLMSLCLIFLPSISMAMDLSSECRNRHTPKTLPSDTTVSPANCTKATENAEDNFILGVTYLRKKNYQLSIDYFTKSAKLNNKDSEYNLGVIAEYGLSESFPINLKDATYWYQRAHEHGDEKAKKALTRVREKETLWGFW